METKLSAIESSMLKYVHEASGLGSPLDAFIQMMLRVLITLLKEKQITECVNGQNFVNLLIIKNWWKSKEMKLKSDCC